jgi:hypothetical protein
LHTGHNSRARRYVLRDFCNRRINILCATEAAGMVWTVWLHIQLIKLNVSSLGN